MNEQYWFRIRAARVKVNTVTIELQSQVGEKEVIKLIVLIC